MLGAFNPFWPIAALCLALPSASAAQVPLWGSGHDSAYPRRFTLSRGEASLQALSEDGFATFSHPSKPNYGLRIKKLPKDFCEPSAHSYSGYLDVGYGTKHMFFYFFESRQDPVNDDVMMWINGGPGGSSAMGLFNELGPCSVADPLAKGPNATKFNPYSWNTNTNLFFLDQPCVRDTISSSCFPRADDGRPCRVGVGFSYAEYGQTVSTTEDAAKDVEAFITLFFETFSQYGGRAFHMTGESYGVCLSDTVLSLQGGLNSTFIRVDTYLYSLLPYMIAILEQKRRTAPPST